MSEKKNLRLGVRVTGGKQWIAGFHYLKNLFIALRNAGQELDLVLYAAHETDPSELQAFAEYAKEIIEYAEFKKDKVRRFLQQQNLDCVFATAEYGPDLGIPHLSWLFDFQHKDMPELFPERDLNIREEMFQYVLERANIVILSSNHAQAACRKFYPQYVGKTRVMPFVAHVPDAMFKTDPVAAVREYDLPSKFIFLPNQFWKHKNHDVVIEAVNKAVKKEPSLTVVFSGTPEDTRDRFYGPYLRSKIQIYELQKHIKILGLIPEEDVFALMRASICILQPSLYEGWSTVVEQAKSLGKPILLSDLEVHREQNPEKGQYFEIHDANQLAHLLISIMREGVPGPDKQAERAALAMVHERSVIFGKQFCQLVDEAIDTFHNNSAPQRSRSELLI
jgi:glycosyltransferase involved in cell wall biosynthesis